MTSKLDKRCRILTSIALSSLLGSITLSRMLKRTNFGEKRIVCHKVLQPVGALLVSIKVCQFFRNGLHW